MIDHAVKEKALGDFEAFREMLTQQGGESRTLDDLYTWLAFKWDEAFNEGLVVGLKNANGNKYYINTKQ